MKRVSVCVPCSNHIKTIASCLESALGQSCEDWELLVCDDGSTDGSADIVRSFAEGNDQIRTTFHDESQGYAATLNELLAQSDSEYVTVLSPYDRYLDPEVLQRAIAVLDADPHLGLSYGAFADLDDEGHAQSVNREFDRQLRMDGIELQHTILRFRMPRLSTVVFRRSVLSEAAALSGDEQTGSEIRWLFEIAGLTDVLFAAKLGVGHPMEGLPGTSKLNDDATQELRKITLRATRTLAVESRELSVAWESSRRLLSARPAIPADAQQILERSNELPRAPLPAPTSQQPVAGSAGLYAEHESPTEQGTDQFKGRRGTLGDMHSDAAHLSEPEAALPKPAPQASTQRRLLVFGPCVSGMDLVESGTLTGNVLAFADAAPEAQGKSLLGIPVLHPRDALALEIDAVVLIAEMHHEKIEAWFGKNRPNVEIVRIWDGAAQG